MWWGGVYESGRVILFVDGSGMYADAVSHYRSTRVQGNG